MIYIQTLDRGTINLEITDPDSLVLSELVRALAGIRRFNGRGYSAAQHCVHVAEILRDRGYPAGVQAGGLFHDLHEAIVGDVSTPVKMLMRKRGFDFAKIVEAPLIDAVEARFHVVVRQAPIKLVDSQICSAEADHFLGGRVGPGWPDIEPISMKIFEWSEDTAFHQFMTLAHKLGIR